MRRNWVVIGVIVAVLAVMLWTTYRHQQAVKRGVASGALRGRPEGRPAPDFALADLRTGKTVHLSDFKGRAVLLNFWATWCPPCKAEIPWFVDLQKQYGPQGLTVIGVLVLDDATRDAKLKFVDDMAMNYPVLVGTDAVGAAYGNVEDLPTSFYIGRDGRIVKSVLGLRGHGEIQKYIELALRQGEAKVAGGPSAGQPAAGR